MVLSGLSQAMASIKIVKPALDTLSSLNRPSSFAWFYPLLYEGQTSQSKQQRIYPFVGAQFISKHYKGQRYHT